MYLNNKLLKTVTVSTLFKLLLICLMIDFTTMALLRQYMPIDGVQKVFLESLIFILIFSVPFYYFYYRPLLNFFNTSTEVLKEFETVLKTTTDGFWITRVKDDGQFLFVNDAYCSMIGYTREELLKMKISDIDSFQSPEVMKNYFAKIIETGHDRFITKHRTKSGEILEILVSVTYLNINEGRFYVFLNDITREQIMKRNIISQNEKLYEIAFLQSHQVRTPIVNVLGIINLINFENPNDPENPELISALKTVTNDFDSIIRKIVSKTHEIDKLRNTEESLDNLV